MFNLLFSKAFKFTRKKSIEEKKERKNVLSILKVTQAYLRKFLSNLNTTLFNLKNEGF